MTQTQWLIDEAITPDSRSIEQIERELGSQGRGSTRESFSQPETVNLAVRLQDIFIEDTKKWFGGADIRLDALVVSGSAKGEAGSPESFYMPHTFRFPKIKDGDRLSTGENGLLIYYGEALHFLDIFITVSRDRKDSDNLATLLAQKLQSTKIQGAVGTFLGLAGVVAPQVTAVNAAISAASILGDFAYKLLREVTGDTIGLYRTSWLQYRDNFGIGRHPHQSYHNVQDLSFWYEIIKEEGES